MIKFFGYKHPLSNFYERDTKIGPFIYPTNEHWFQSENCADFYDKIDVIMADGPKEAKKLGREFEMRDNWDEIKVLYMYKGLRAKFTKNRDLMKYLLDTGDAELVEDSPYDSYWGRGRDWKGENKMGKLLMRLRDELRKKA